MSLLQHHGVRTSHLWASLAFALLSWIILLAGMAAVQDDCRSSQAGVTFFQANRVCSSAYRYPWWIVWLALAVFLGVIFTALFGTLDRGRVALVGFLSFTAVLLVIQTDAFLTAHDSDNRSARVTTTFVGFLLTTIATLALIISVGTVHAHDVDAVATGHTRGGITSSKV